MCSLVTNSLADRMIQLQLMTKFITKRQKTALWLKPQAIENSFKRAYGEVEDNIIIYIERLKT